MKTKELKNIQDMSVLSKARLLINLLESPVGSKNALDRSEVEMIGQRLSILFEDLGF